jgi:hypothetical protein
MHSFILLTQTDQNPSFLLFIHIDIDTTIEQNTAFIVSKNTIPPLPGMPPAMPHGLRCVPRHGNYYVPTTIIILPTLINGKEEVGPGNGGGGTLFWRPKFGWPILMPPLMLLC